MADFKLLLVNQNVRDMAKILHCLKADFLSWQKSMACLMRILIDNFSLLSPLQGVFAAWFKIFN